MVAGASWRPRERPGSGQAFAQRVRARRAEPLEAWRARAAESPFVPVQRLAQGLHDDYDAVNAGRT